MALPVEKVHRPLVVVDMFRHCRRQQRDLSRVDRPWDGLSGWDGGRRRTALRGRDRVAVHVHECTRKRLCNETHGLVHGPLGLRDATVDDDVVDDVRRNRDHTAHDRVCRAAIRTRLARGVVLARKNGDAAN